MKVRATVCSFGIILERAEEEKMVKKMNAMSKSALLILIRPSRRRL